MFRISILVILLLSGCMTPDCPVCQECPPAPNCYEQVIEARTKCVSELVDYKVELLKCQKGKK